MAGYPLRHRKGVLAHMYLVWRSGFHIFGGPAIEKNQQLKNRSIPIIFIIGLVVGSILLFLGHAKLQVLYGYEPYGNQLIKSYLLNSILACLIFFAIYFYRNKYRDYLGFFFLIGSLLKFGVFFVAFYSGYKSDGVLERAEFLAFFVPYLYSLTLETLFLGKLLNSVR